MNSPRKKAVGKSNAKSNIIPPAKAEKPAGGLVAKRRASRPRLGMGPMAEAKMIVDALNEAEGNFTKTAAIIGITRKGLRLKIARLNLDIRPLFKLRFRRD
jgi:DNA-binding NtrC family response regulator